MATKSVMRQSWGIKSAVARIMTPMMDKRDRSMETRNFFNTLGTSMKKLENSASLEVEPQLMSISNMCAKRAWLTCRDRPPRNRASMRVHLKFSQTAYPRVRSPDRYRMMARDKLPRPLKTMMMENHA